MRKVCTQVQESVTTTSTDLLDADDTRTALVISCPIANRITISLQQIAVDAEGIMLFAGGSPLSLNEEEHGDIVKRKITAIASAGTREIGIFIVKRAN